MNKITHSIDKQEQEFVTKLIDKIKYLNLTGEITDQEKSDLEVLIDYHCKGNGCIYFLNKAFKSDCTGCSCNDSSIREKIGCHGANNYLKSLLSDFKEIAQKHSALATVNQPHINKLKEDLFDFMTDYYLKINGSKEEKSSRTRVIHDQILQLFEGCEKCGLFNTKKTTLKKFCKASYRIAKSKGCQQAHKLINNLIFNQH